MQHSEMSSIGSLTDLSHHDRKTSIVDDLLCEIYDRWYDGRHDSFESDTFTECSSTSEVYHWHRNSFQLENDNKHSTRILPSVLQTQSKQLISRIIFSLFLSPFSHSPFPYPSVYIHTQLSPSLVYQFNIYSLSLS